MGKPKNARNVKTGDKVILKSRKGKDPIILNNFHNSNDSNKIFEIIEVDRTYARSFPTAKVKIKSKNSNWSENFYQTLALEDLLKV